MPSLPQLLKELERQSGQLDARAVRAILAAFRQDEAVRALLQELLSLMLLRDPAARLRAAERMKAIAASLWPAAPAPLALALTQGVQLGGTVGLGMLSTPAVTLEIVSPAVQAAARATEARYLSYWGDQRADHAARMGRIITEALTVGGKRFPLKQTIQAQLQVSRGKAAQLAHDGIMSALSEGQRAVWDTARDDLGLRMEKTWLHSKKSKNARPDHVALDGRTLPYEKDFIAGVLAYPRDPRGTAKHNSRCKCSMIVRVLDS